MLIVVMANVDDEILLNRITLFTLDVLNDMLSEGVVKLDEIV